MKILITGASGLVGTRLCERLVAEGHAIHTLVRREPRTGTESRWDPATGSIDAAALEGLDGVVHLAGESIAEGRWNAAKKQRIRTSRVQGTQLLAGTLAGLAQKPTVLVSASAIGFYGDRGEELLTESAPAGGGFLAGVCAEWEAATEAAVQAGIRTVTLRIGVVLDRQGGALAKMLTPFKFGAGGVLGSGRQYMSWIALDDLVAVLQFALLDAPLQGPVNAVAPEPVTNREFTKTLGGVLSRPTILPVPAFAARLAFGEMAQELLLASMRVQPDKLLAAGFAFAHPQLDGALRAILGKA
ncbi:MAG TPA: TIGR01777 family oxidoreductase [Planctomycetota bacterium]